MKLPAFKRIRIRRTYFICFAIIVTFNIGFVGSFLLVGYNGEGTTVKVASCPLITGGKCPDPRVTFYLYTPLNPTLPEKIEYTEKSSNLLQLNFNTSLPTKIFTHGYNSGKFIFDHLRREYLERGDYNIILQDWADLVPSPCYFTAAHNTRFAGRCLAEMVRRVWATGATDVHLVGFSLGAHVPAFAANDLRPLRLPRITGLDPAMPLFVTSNRDEKLDASDALFVDVVHTNALAQGKVEQCGHIDFYMNGGITQPGCYGESGCNHHRSLTYFAESVRSEAGFWGWPCGGVMHYILGLCPPRGTPWKMGEDVDQRGQGFYVVRTNSAAPFARGPWQVAPTEFTRTGLRFLRSPWAPFRRR